MKNGHKNGFIYIKNKCNWQINIYIITLKIQLKQVAIFTYQTGKKEKKYLTMRIMCGFNYSQIVMVRL